MLYSSLAMPHCGGEGQGAPKHQRAREKHRNIAVFSLVMPGSAAGSSLQRSSVAAAAQPASFGAILRAQGRHRKPSLKAGAGYREVFLHRKCQPLVASAPNTSLSCLTNKPQVQPEMPAVQPFPGRTPRWFPGLEVIQKQVQFSDSLNIRPPITRIHSKPLDAPKQPRTSPS